MKSIINLLTIASLATTVALSAESGDPNPGWPQFNGPYGNFTPRKYGHKLVDDLSQTKKLWESENQDLGSGKKSILITTYGPGDKFLPGSWGSLIVAEGKVFASSYRPVKEYYKVPVEGNPDKVHGKSGVKFQKTEDGKHYLLNMDAEDITVAMDAATGKTVWLAAEPGGFLAGGGKRLTFQVSPAYHGGPSSPSATTRQGRVFSMGTTGRLFAYDAATGKKLWQTTIPAYEGLEALRQEILTKLKAGKWGGWHRDLRKWATSLVVARTGADSAVLVVPLYDSKGTLRGVDMATGKSVWDTPEVQNIWATPTLWTDKKTGKQYLLCGRAFGAKMAGDGDLKMIDPTDGKVLWTLTGTCGDFASVVATDEHVFVNHKTKYERPGNAFWARLAAYRISTEKAELAWVAPEEPQFCYINRLDTCAMRKVMARDGLVYHGVNTTPESELLGPGTKGVSNNLFIFDEKTGKVLHSSMDTLVAMSYLVEDRFIFTPDASHSFIHFFMHNADPKDFRKMGEWSPGETTSGYEVYIESPFVDGRFYMRTVSGGVACYDLRKP